MLRSRRERPGPVPGGWWPKVGAALRPLALLLAAAPGAAAAIPADQVPDDMVGVGITEKLDAVLPLDLELTLADPARKTGDAWPRVKLRELFVTEGGTNPRPVILTLNYSDCPMLCNLQLNGLVEGLKTLAWTAGQEFDVVTVSLNPAETPERAAATHDRYLKAYGRPEAAPGWRFLVADEPTIRAIADAVGFGYRYVEERKEYAHAAAVVLVAPNGHVARYLYGIEYPSDTLKMGLLEASRGEIGTTLDRLVLYCFHYNPKEGRYTPAAMNVMRLGGGVTVLLLGSLIGTYVLRERRARRGRAAGPSDDARGGEPLSSAAGLGPSGHSP
jgi:protein SCO1/2